MVCSQDKVAPTQRGLGRRVYSIGEESNFAIGKVAVTADIMNNNSWV
jgi:hypothetical protein